VTSIECISHNLVHLLLHVLVIKQTFGKNDTHNATAFHVTV